MDKTVCIYLTCPNCGSNEWTHCTDNENTGVFKCASCREIAYPEDMTAEVSPDRR